MKKVLKKIGALVLASLLCIGVTACDMNSEGTGGTGSGSGGGAVAQTQVWTAYGTEKILADVDYSDRYDGKTLTIKAFRNEYESAQIILTPDADVKSYTLTLSDLTSGANVLPKSSFTVYNEKYVFVSEIKDPNVSTGAGYYPDALLPYDVAVAHGENKIEAGNNQGLWITMYADASQAAGVYTGKFTVTADGKEYEVPVSVTIYDYTLSDTVHSKSSFLINAEELAVGELDATNEMIETYHDFLLDFRISPNHLPGNDYYATLQGDALEAFLQSAVKAAKDPRCSTYNIPYIDSSASVSVNGGSTSIQTVDFTLFESTLKAMAQRSVQENVNLFAKAQTYIVFLDEYDYNNRITEANYNFAKMDELCRKVAQDLEKTLDCGDAAFKQQLLADLAGIRHKCVGSLNDDMTAKATMVSKIDKYNTQASRQEYIDWAEEKYGESGELWTYTAMDPYPPYPTYHLEDVLISSRLLGWMMYNYNIVGNLYWNTTLYTYSDGYNTNGQIQDYYDTALRFYRSNGDGYLMYPGRPYGIYGPVASVRLHSIRDGNEDYDLLYHLEELYKERGVSGDDFDTILKYLTQNLYTGTQCNTSAAVSENLMAARDMLAQLIVLAENGVVIERATIKSITNDAEEKYDVIDFDVSAKEGTVLKLGDTTLTGGTASDGIVTYKASVDMVARANALVLTATVDGKSYSLNLDLGAGGKVKTQTTSFTALDSKISVNAGTKSTSTVDGTNVIKLTSTALTSAQTFRADVDVEELSIGNNIKRIVLKIYAQTGGDSVRVSYQGVDGSGYLAVLDGYALQQGWNEIAIDVSLFNCDRDGIVKSLRIAFPDSKMGKIMYLADITLEVLV